MKLFSQAKRVFMITRVAIRYGLDDQVLTLLKIPALQTLYKVMPWKWKKREATNPAEGLRCALEDLGPVFVKFGQVLSTRRDMLTEDYANELAKLQDKVPPFPSDQAIGLIEASLNQSVDEVFKRFDREPLAAASIAQVYSASLQDGKEVVVKVVRPNIENIIQQDIDLMFLMAKLLSRMSNTGKRLRPVEVVAEYEKTIFDELDLQREAANANQLRRNFENSPDVYIPKVYWDHCAPNVLVMERIYGVNGGDIETLKRKGTNMKVLAERGVDIFFTQVFKHNFFHADMHPGNVFVNADNPDDPSYISIDFGIVGSLSLQDQRYLAENLHAFFNRDYKRVAEVHIESGWVPAHTSVVEFEAAIRTVCEPIFQLTFKDISYGKLLLRLFQTAQRFDMEVQPQLVLLQKTLLNIEGMGRDVYPDLDLWVTAKPFLERWMDEQVGLRAFVKNASKNFPKFVEQLPNMPVTLNEVIMQYHQEQREKSNKDSQQSLLLQQTIKQSNQRLVMSIAGASLLIAAVIDKGLSQQQELSTLGFMVGGIGLVLLLLALLRK
ncbi:ubiquinone biosynthesis regulatory protein kinase UbiB [Leucothrix arctica]|uniref:Ubiquinone biosynthesis regulatory protein kinase UbiB n=1 Tax=Leucothrix arctica TaxID=1481894 RepID=A0A317C732_9GAMM|nr:ubiquinone biosynthesis regulatory protein kinase UbiB [Leucothrix arctica]PWQ94107.1 ubiquinone biosynthesis regulatory protein kinase UbiB [Leucothrix arctica]